MDWAGSSSMPARPERRVSRAGSQKIAGGRPRCAARFLFRKRELASVLCNTAECARDRRIQNVDHEGVGRHVPFRHQSKLRCGLKPESRIESRMADDDDERASCGSQALDPGSYEETADASPLMRGGHRHWSQSSAGDGPDQKRAEHNVANDGTTIDRHQRQHRGTVGTKRVDNPTLQILAERLSIHMSNSFDVARLLVSDFSQCFAGPAKAALRRCSGRP